MANMSTPVVIEKFGEVDLMYISIESTIGLASVLGNVLVVLVVTMNKALRDPTFCFLVSLALADIAVGTLVIPLSVVISLGPVTPFYTCVFISSLLIIITQSSILSLLAITIDRFLRVKIPTSYSIIVTQRRVWIAVGFCWILSFLAGLVPMAGWHQSPPGNNSTASIQCQFSSVMSMNYMVYFNFFGWVVVPLTVMIGLYAEIFRIISSQLNRRAAATTTDSSKYYRKQLKLAKSFALVLFLFALCWLPLHCMNCIVFFCPTCNVPKSAFYVGIFMSHGNSALNPLVYAFRIQRVRDTFVHIIQRFVLCKTTSSISCRHGPGPVTENTQVQM
ncbi:adenosine receptor A1 [Xyrauchen texanus]|uniref:adenosine receptor A1 n=1 Tax=Xyrauchen texanus TaxID=154827 RepID=UPI002242A20E|nr:adenosine receptor A1 [Xyrauchen texanus]